MVDSWCHYPQTILRFPFADRAIDLRSELPAEERLFLKNLFPRGRFAIVTPANPHGTELSKAENERRLNRFAIELDVLHIPHVRADGASHDGSHVEPGFAVPLKLLAAVRLAQHWEQVGLFWFDGSRIWVVPADHEHEALPLPQ
jgi:Protein of unknown function (DUF3293)